MASINVVDNPGDASVLTDSVGLSAEIWQEGNSAAPSV